MKVWYEVEGRWTHKEPGSEPFGWSRYPMVTNLRLQSEDDARDIVRKEFLSIERGEKSTGAYSLELRIVKVTETREVVE